MTEADWLACATHPRRMLPAALESASRRTLQLLACALCRRLWDHFRDSVADDCRNAVHAAELYADGRCSEAKYHDACEQLYRNSAAQTVLPGCDDVSAVVAAVHPNLNYGLEETVHWVLHCGGGPDAAVCDLIREVVGNPFRPWRSNPPWLGGGLLQPDGTVIPVTADVRGLSETIAETLAFDRLPVLADAAEEAGVTDEVLLAHLRTGTGHVRGCWALDALRGRN